MCKVGLVAPTKFHARAFHPTALCATFASAAVTGKLRGLGVNQMVNAFGICGSQSSGIIEYLADGTWTKRLHPGWSAHAGFVACLLAEQGFLGPASVFEGRHGFYQAFAGGDGLRFDKLAELGQLWEIPRIAFKSYPCGSISHPYIDCALRLRESHTIEPQAVDEVICRTAEGPVHRLWEPLAEKRRPTTSYGAKFSLPYSIAVALVRGKAGLEEFSDNWIRDPEILALAAKVNYQLDPTIDYPRHFSGHVQIRLSGGRVYEANQPFPRGGLESPLAAAEIEEKFRANARMVLSEEKIGRIVTCVRNLEAIPVAALARELTPGSS
jgi:2-methylcitrate dehydratase PrpD